MAGPGVPVPRLSMQMLREEAEGTVSAVEALLPLTEGLLRDGALKEAARDAVRRIQARLGAVEAGRLSLAEDVAGRL